MDAIISNINKSVGNEVITIHSIINKLLKSKGIVSKSTNEVELVFKNNSIELELPTHWAYIDKGRKYGKYPPIKPILNWITEKKIQIPKGITKIQLAYMISTSIYKKGIKARPFIEELSKLITSHLSSQYTKNFNNNLQKMLKK